MRLIKSILAFFNPADMSKKSGKEIIFYTTSTGRIFVKEDEFLRSNRVQRMIQKLLNSRLYKDIKDEESRTAAHR